MLRLITFGGLSLLHGEILLRAHAPRERVLPMLALLATEGGRGLPRDRLATLLWPDSDPQRARHSLEEVVSQARRLGRLAGCADVFAPAPALVLDPHAISVDLWDLEAALRHAELERAVAICDGRRFAEDVSLAGCDGIESRFAVLAERYAREVKEALATLAARAADLGDQHAVVRWTQRLVDADPTDRHAVLALVDTLDAQQERAGALSAAQRYQRSLEQMELPPDDEVTERIRRLRAAPPAPARPWPHLTARADADAPTEVDAARARLGEAVAARYRLTGPGVDGSAVTSYPARRLVPPQEPVEIHAIRADVARRTSADAFVGALRRVASLQHPGILPVVDCDAREEVRYFVTPRRGGPSLRRRLRDEGQLPIGDAVAIAHATGAALAHAHAHGVVHGDLRPKHIHLTGAGEPVVGFFGVSGALVGEQQGADGSYMVWLGEQAYQSPEQLRHAVGTSARSDVYAFGAIVYHLLLGEPPFATAGASVDVARRLTQAPPDLRSRRESVPEGLERVVLTCLARVPADRYGSGVELARALEEAVR